MSKATRTRKLIEDTPITYPQLAYLLCLTTNHDLEKLFEKDPDWNNLITKEKKKQVDDNKKLCRKWAAAIRDSQGEFQTCVLGQQVAGWGSHCPPGPSIYAIAKLGDILKLLTDAQIETLFPSRVELHEKR